MPVFSSAPRNSAELLPIEALTPDGLLVRSDGALVRYLEVIPSNPLVLDRAACERMTHGLSNLIARIPAGMNIQAYVEATPVALDDVLAGHRAETDRATEPAAGPTRDALRRLAAAHEDSLATHAADQAALRVRYLLVVPYMPTGRRPGPRSARRKRSSSKATILRRSVEAHERLAREAMQHADRLRSALAGLDLKATLLNGAQIADLLHRRFAPRSHDGLLWRQALDAADPSVLAPLHAPIGPAAAALAAARLRQVVATAAIDTADRRHLIVDGALEQTIYVSRTPERTFYGWLLHAMQSPEPWTLSIHIYVRDRVADRDRENRRARRLWGVNEGALDRRARPDRAQHDQQQELEELVEELGTGGQTLTDTAVYLTLRAHDRAALDEAITHARSDLQTAVDAQTSAGNALQLPLWTSSLPLALDDARKTVRLISRNAADTMPFVSTSCGSPTGIPLGFADPGRTLERINPFDRLHDNGTTLLFAKSGGGKTMTTIALASAAIPRGCQVNVLDRSAGHYRFLADLIPGAAHLELGDEHGNATINPWDTEDPNNVPRSKVAFLVRLHALLIGDHDSDHDSYGLQPLERNLLAIAIRRTYADAAATDTEPSESALHATLVALAASEHPEAASVYRNLAHRLSEYTADGTYGYLFDRPTTIAADDAPLVVFNTRKVPDDVAAPVLFALLEFVSQRVERRHERHLRRLADDSDNPPAGPFDGSSAVVVEELWKLVERKATGAWVNELVKRARHIGLWFIAITQQRSDLAGPQGRALLDNSTIQIFLRNGPDDVAHVAQALQLSEEEVAQISQLTTEKRSHAQAYVINGERGRGAVTIRLGSDVYWLATSDPIADVPLRNLALNHAGGDPFAALDLLSDPRWRGRSAEGRGGM